MPLGPGKYDPLCTDARERSQARGVLLIVIGGEHGDGFSCQGDALVLAQLPDLLEFVAREIRQTGPFGPVRRG
jgi:hypothetical protein